MYKLSPYKNLDDYQLQVEENALKTIFEDLLKDKQTSIVIEGEPGTGKSVLAIHMLKKIKDLCDEDDENDKYLEELIKRFLDSNSIKLSKSSIFTIIIPLIQVDCSYPKGWTSDKVPISKEKSFSSIFPSILSPFLNL